MLILSTSAELDLMKDMRTAEYIKTIDWLKENASQYNVVWLECVSNEQPPYLNDAFPYYCTNCHNPYYVNQGANHGRALKKFFDDCEVEDTLAVQITGRYHFLDTYFFDTIENNPGYDLYVKNTGDDQYFTGCFAIKTDYLIEWVNTTDWDALNLNMINFEKSLWTFSKEKNLNCYEIDSIHMDCNIFGKGNLSRALV
jgi:hypothetical protein